MSAMREKKAYGSSKNARGKFKVNGRRQSLLANCGNLLGTALTSLTLRTATYSPRLQTFRKQPAIHSAKNYGRKALRNFIFGEKTTSKTSYLCPRTMKYSSR